ncbi:MAG TPA: glycosyltransferase family 2 protein, partial [Herpetosiphonaceae bacterium]
PAPDISVIVLNWNGRDLLPGCLDSLIRQTANCEIILVDNGSRDGSARYVAERWPQVRLLALAHNRGFSGGVNAGLLAARGRYLALFNNDAAATSPDFLERLAAPLEADPTLGCAAGALTFAHQPDLVASAGIRMLRNGLALDAGALEPVSALPDAPRPVFGASGGAACFRREALQDVGVFDEGYFAYLEDADLAWRLRGRGWGCALAPGAIATHIYSATGGEGSPLKNWLLGRNRLRLLLRCLPAPILRRDWPAIVAYDALAMAQAVARRRWTTITGRLAALADWRALLDQRRVIQSRYTTRLMDLDGWIEPDPGPLALWRDARRLAAVLADRPAG